MVRLANSIHFLGHLFLPEGDKSLCSAPFISDKIFTVPFRLFLSFTGNPINQQISDKVGRLAMKCCTLSTSLATKFNDNNILVHRPSSVYLEITCIRNSISLWSVCASPFTS